MKLDVLKSMTLLSELLEAVRGRDSVPLLPTCSSPPCFHVTVSQIEELSASSGTGVVAITCVLWRCVLRLMELCMKVCAAQRGAAPRPHLSAVLSSEQLLSVLTSVVAALPSLFRSVAAAACADPSKDSMLSLLLSFVLPPLIDGASASAQASSASSELSVAEAFIRCMVTWCAHIPSDRLPSLLHVTCSSTLAAVVESTRAVQSPRHPRGPSQGLSGSGQRTVLAAVFEVAHSVVARRLEPSVLSTYRDVEPWWGLVITVVVLAGDIEPPSALSHHLEEVLALFVGQTTRAVTTLYPDDGPTSSVAASGVGGGVLQSGVV